MTAIKITWLQILARAQRQEVARSSLLFFVTWRPCWSESTDESRVEMYGDEFKGAKENFSAPQDPIWPPCNESLFILQPSR